jgi:hypothetical protein
MDPVNALAFFNRGVALDNLGNKSEACDDWRKAVAYGESAAAALLQEFCL